MSLLYSLGRSAHNTEYFEVTFNLDNLVCFTDSTFSHNLQSNGFISSLLGQPICRIHVDGDDAIPAK